MMEFSFRLRVYIEDTDAGGIVYYVNYLKYMERGRTEMVRELGIEPQDIVDQGYGFVVHSAEIRYLRPARLDDDLRVVTSIAKHSRASAVFDQQIWRGDEQLCKAMIRVACIDQASMRPTSLPEVMRNYLQNQVAEPA